MAKIGRPKHEPTPETRAQVVSLVAFGIKNKNIAEFIGIDQTSLVKHYKHEIEVGLDRCNVAVAKFVHKAATGKALEDGATHGECLRAAQFWLKSRAGWKEQGAIDLTSSDGSMRPTVIEVAAGSVESKD